MVGCGIYYGLLLCGNSKLGFCMAGYRVAATAWQFQFSQMPTPYGAWRLSFQQQQNGCIPFYFSVPKKQIFLFLFRGHSLRVIFGKCNFHHCNALKYRGIAPKTSCPIVLRIPVEEYSKGFNKPCVGLHNLHPPSSGQKLRKLRLRVCALTSLLIARSLRRLQRKVECLIIWT